MTTNTRSLEERLSAEEILRRWASAYRNGPAKYRFPCDPRAEFFPVDMETIAAALAAKDKLLAEARGVLEPWYKARLALCAAHVNTPECAAAFTALGKAENDLSTFARTTLANLKAGLDIPSTPTKETHKCP